MHRTLFKTNIRREGILIEYALGKVGTSRPKAQKSPPRAIQRMRGKKRNTVCFYPKIWGGGVNLAHKSPGNTEPQHSRKLLLIARRTHFM